MIKPVLSSSQLTSVNRFAERCEDLRITAEQALFLVEHHILEYNSIRLGIKAAKNFEKIAIDLDQASLNLKFGLKIEPKVALMETFRHALDDKPPKSSGPDAITAEDRVVLKVLAEIEKQVLEMIDDAYKHVEVNPATAIHIAEHFTYLYKEFQGSMAYLDDLLNPPE